MATALLVASSALTFWIPCWLRLHSPTRTQASLKAQGCLFQLTHMSRDDTLFNWSSHGSQNEDKTLLQCSQRCHKGEFRHVSTTVITTVWTESSWAFPGSYTAWSCARAMAENGETKWAHNSITKVSFCTIIIRLCPCTITQSFVLLTELTQLTLQDVHLLCQLSYVPDTLRTTDPLIYHTLCTAVWNIFCKSLCGNCTPGSRSYSDLVDPWTDSVKVYQHNGLFQLMHTSSQDSAVSVAQDSLDEQQLAVVYQ